GPERGAEASRLSGLLHDQVTGDGAGPGHRAACGRVPRRLGGRRRRPRRGDRDLLHLAPEGAMSRALRIAVAEDERGPREYLQALVTRQGHQVVTATTGKELVELCRVAEPELVLTDIRMPDMDGLAAAEEINKRRAVPVILISAYHDAATRERALSDHVM